MEVVIEDLELAPYGRAVPLVQFRVHEILDSAVGSRGDLEVHAEDEVPVCAGGDDVTTVGGFSSVAFLHFEYAVFYRPALFRETGQLCTSPSFSGLAVPEKFPSFSGFFRGYGVVYKVHERCAAALRGKVFLYISGAYADVFPADALPFQRRVGDCMNLQGDEPFGGPVIPYLCARDAVDPCADGVAESLYAGLVPLSVPEGGLCVRVLCERIEPAPGRLVIYAA